MVREGFKWIDIGLRCFWSLYCVEEIHFSNQKLLGCFCFQRFLFEKNSVQYYSFEEYMLNLGVAKVSGRWHHLQESSIDMRL
jgi:hypothetical protein